MRLNALEREMRAGKLGAAAKAAIEHQIKVGEFFGARDFVPVTQAHIMADTESLGEAGVAWLESLAKDGGKVRVPTITDPRGTDFAKLDVLKHPARIQDLERRTNVLCEGLERAARDAGVAFWTNRACAMFGLFFTSTPVTSYADAVRCDVAAFKRFFNAMLARGVYLAPSAFEAGFISSAHGDAEIEATIAAARESFSEVAS